MGGKNTLKINRDLKRKPQEHNSQCSASTIQEKGKSLRIEKRCWVFFFFVLFNATENKRLKTRRKRLSHHCLPIMNFKSTEPIM